MPADGRWDLIQRLKGQIIFFYRFKDKGKGKVNPRKGHEGPEAE
jgi:hypothetical protein